MDETLKDGIHSLGSNQENLRLWNRYVGEAPIAGFHHLFEWKEIYEREFQHQTFYVASVNQDKVDGIFPLVLMRSRVFGNILCSLPFASLGGPSATDLNIRRSLLKRAYEIATEEKVDYLEIRGYDVCDETLPHLQNKISMSVPLANDPDDLWNAFKSKHRNNIRRVYKSGLHVRSGHADMLDTFYDIMCDSWRTLGTPIYRKQYFRSILDAFDNQARIFVAYQGQIPVATAFNGYCGNTVEGMWAGTIADHRKLQSNYVLYWEMIKDACEQGFEHFNLGRTPVESGGESFKRKWGADSQQLYWQYFLPKRGDIPQLNVSNPKYALAIKVWKNLPLWVTRTIGPIIAKNIP